MRSSRERGKCRQGKGSILDTFLPEGLIFQHHVFLPFHTVHGVLAVKCWSGFPFSPSVDHVLSELSTMTHPSWVALHGTAHGFIEFQKPLPQDKAVILEVVSYMYIHLTDSFRSRY